MSPKKTKPTPTLSAPVNIPTGSSVTVTGSGFKPGSLVTLDDSHMNPANNDLVIGDDGLFVHDMGFIYTKGGSAAVRALVNQEQVAYARFTVGGLP